MPSKPEFDPRLHLVGINQIREGSRDPRGILQVSCDVDWRAEIDLCDDTESNRFLVEVDDEALARKLHKQFLEEDRNLQDTERQNEVGDLELARVMQNEENAQQQVANRNGVDNARNTGVKNQAFTEIDQDCLRSSIDHDDLDRTEVFVEENDLQVARCMQELGQMGVGRLNSSILVYVDPPPRNNPTEKFSRDSVFLQSQLVEGIKQNATPTGIRGEATLGNSSSRNNVSISMPAEDSKEDSSDPSESSEINLHEENERVTSQQSRSSQSHLVDPPGIALSPTSSIDVFSPDGADFKKKKKRVRILNSFLGKGVGNDTTDKLNLPPWAESTLSTRASIPARVRPPLSRTPLTRKPGPLPHSVSGSTQTEVLVAPDVQHSKKNSVRLPSPNNKAASCSVCGKSASSFLIALGKKYHQECFKCIGCHKVIDSSGSFAYVKDESGEHPLHRTCYAELYGVKCTVCKQSIPTGLNGEVSFVKHPFFDTEQMCPRHASNPGRRCTGCHRFEPEGLPFADLGDSNRCVCFSCCRTVVVDGNDAKPLWCKVVHFLENKLKLPIWKDLRDVPVLIVGFDALNNQLIRYGGAHGGPSQIMTRGLCLTEHQSGRKVKLSRLKYDEQNQSFDACDVEEKGFTFFQVPDANKFNPDACVTAILCLSGLPGDLTASVLAHEATHAWIKLHPRFNIGCPIPPMVEEGVAQLIAMLFLTDGLEAASTETYGDKGPSDEKLRQYFKFGIETDDHEIYGEGYRKAAKAYADIGIKALLSHVVLYNDFPTT